MRKIDLFPRRPLHERLREAVAQWLRRTFGLVPSGQYANLQARYAAAEKEHAAAVAKIQSKVDDLWPIMVRMRQEADGVAGTRIAVQVEIDTYMLRAFREFDFEYLGESLARRIAHQITGALMRGEINQPPERSRYPQRPGLRLDASNG